MVDMGKKWQDKDWFVVALVLGATLFAGLLWMTFSRSNPMSYKAVSNTEEWELVEDDVGNLKKIIVHRDVKRR